MRTREQIIADCEKRFEELRKEKDRRDSEPRFTRPCTSCRFYSEPLDFMWEKRYCTEPLVRGFAQDHTLYHELHLRAGWRDDNGDMWNFPWLCGYEKALWQPKQTIIERIISFLTGEAK